MTIATTTSRSPYIGNGSASTYAYGFKISRAADLLVTIRDTTNVETTLVLNTDYTVSGVGDLSGGSIALIGTVRSWLTSGNLKTDYVLVLRRVVPLLQSTDIRNQGDFYPEAHEDAFDSFVMIDQQQQDQINRSIKLAETDSPAEMILPVAADREGKFLAFDADGLPMAADAVTGAPVTAFMETVLDDVSARAARDTLGLMTFVSASDYAGADLGAKIIAADSALGSTPGVIVVPAGDATITTQIVLSRANRILKFGFGTYTLNVSASDGANALIINADNIKVCGEGMFATVLKNGTISKDDVIRVISGAHYQDYTSVAAPVNNSATIEDLTIDGNQANITHFANDTYCNGINLDCVNESLVQRCLVKNVVYQGIVLGNGDGVNTRRNRIIGNIVTACGEVGVGAEGGFHETLIQGNEIHDLITTAESVTGAVAVLLGAIGYVDGKMTGTVVSGNSIYNIPNSGIDVQDAVTDLVIVGNNLRSVGTSAGTAIVFTTVGSTDPHSVVIQGNVIVAPANKDLAAIHVDGPTSAFAAGVGFFNIAGNVIRSAQGGGILVTNYVNCNIVNNSIGSAGLGSGTSTDGILVTGKNHLIDGNAIVGTAGAGINLVNGGTQATNVVIGINYFASNSGGKISDAGSGTSFISLAGGKFGVGILAPEETFEVAGTFAARKSATGAYVSLINENTHAMGFARYLLYIGANGASGIAGMKYAPGIELGISVDANDTTTPIKFRTNNGTERGQIDAAGNFVVGSAALATNATDGFFYIPTCAGVPSATPTGFTGRAPMAFNTVDNKFYIYNGSWKSVTIS